MDHLQGLLRSQTVTTFIWRKSASNKKKTKIYCIDFFITHNCFVLASLWKFNDRLTQSHILNFVVQIGFGRMIEQDFVLFLKFDRINSRAIWRHLENRYLTSPSMFPYAELNINKLRNEMYLLFELSTVCDIFKFVDLFLYIHSGIVQGGSPSALLFTAIWQWFFFKWILMTQSHIVSPFSISFSNSRKTKKLTRRLSPNSEARVNFLARRILLLIRVADIIHIVHLAWIYF